MNRLSINVLVCLVCALSQSAFAQEALSLDRSSADLSRVCVVLSVGGVKGVAHIGALDAIDASGVRVRCVYGNSIGAVVGALYATAPRVPLKRRYRELTGAYRSSLVSSIGDGALAVGLLLYFGLEGEADWESLAFTALDSMTKFQNQHARFRRVLDAFLDHSRFEDTNVPFATSHQSRVGDGVRLDVRTSGNLADAVASSINNPYIFKGTSLERVDPGGDRLAAVPLTDACSTFNPSLMIAINVTGATAIRASDMDCETLVVDVPIDDVGEEAEQMLFGHGPMFRKAYDLAYQNTREALQAAGLWKEYNWTRR